MPRSGLAAFDRISAVALSRIVSRLQPPTGSCELILRDSVVASEEIKMINRHRICLGTLLWLGCALDPLLAQSGLTPATSRRVPLRVVSSTTTQPPAFDLDSIQQLNLDHVLWSGNALLALEKSGTEHPIIHSFAADGRDTPAVISIPQAAIVNVNSVAHAARGALLACGYALDSAGHRSGFIYVASPDRQNTQVIRTSGFYYPYRVATTPDGSVWVQGWEPGDIIGKQINWRASVIRRFDKDGRLSGEFLEQRRVLRSMPRNILTSTPGFLASSSTRVGWHPGGAPGSYFEILLDGTVNEYPGVPMETQPRDLLLGLAITDAGDVYASTQVSNHSSRPAGMYLYRLNRASRQWEEVALPEGPQFADLEYMRGVEGNALVFKTRLPDGRSGGYRLLHLE
jgi:hypothetical protein